MVHNCFLFWTNYANIFDIMKILCYKKLTTQLQNTHDSLQCYAFILSVLIKYNSFHNKSKLVFFVCLITEVFIRRAFTAFNLSFPIIKNLIIVWPSALLTRSSPKWLHFVPSSKNCARRTEIFVKWWGNHLMHNYFAEKNAEYYLDGLQRWEHHWEKL